MVRCSTRGVMATALICMAAACSNGGDASPAIDPAAGSDTTTVAGGDVSVPPASGGPCSTADERTDIGGVEHICMVETGEKLVWTPQNTSAGAGAGGSVGQEGLSSSADIPQVMKSWGFDLRPFDPSTGMAGVMKITGARTPEPDPTNRMDSRYLFVDYGTGDDRASDLQMTFFLPLGTPVLSLVDGVVCDVPTLYSGDISVRVAPTGVECVAGKASVMFETEHVLDPLVSVGDTVVAGQQVATVSDYHNDWKGLGFGVVEIGVAFNKNDNSGLPWHACPARFLDPTTAEQLTAVLASIHTAWEAEKGDTSLYDEAAQPILGCTTLDDIQG